MKKVFAMILVLSMVFSCAAMAETFKMGFDAEYPPYSFVGDDGNYTGFDIEMCEKVCAILGWDMEYVPINWDAKLLDLDAKNIDCIWSGLTLNVLDGAKYTLSFAYSDSTQMILTRKDSGIQSFDDLAGKVVGVQLATSADILLSGDMADFAATFGELIRFENYNVCFTELMAGSIDAIAIDVGVAAKKIQDYGDDYVMLEEAWASEQYGICFRLEDAEMCKAVEGAFMQLVEDGTYKALAEKYELDLENLCLLAD